MVNPFGFVKSIVNICFNLWFAIYRDIIGLRFFLKIKEKCERVESEKLTLIDFFRMNLKKHPAKICLEFYDKKWTFENVFLSFLFAFLI